MFSVVILSWKQKHYSFFSTSLVVVICSGPGISVGYNFLVPETNESLGGGGDIRPPLTYQATYPTSLHIHCLKIIHGPKILSIQEI